MMLLAACLNQERRDEDLDRFHAISKAFKNTLLSEKEINAVADVVWDKRPLGREDRPYAGYVDRLFYYSLACGLKSGRVTTIRNGKVVSEADARRIVAYARAQGWLPSEA